VRSRLVIGSGESPHSGQAVMYAAAAGVKRSRQRGQQRRIIGSQRVLSGQAVPTCWADAVHHGVVGAFVIELEVDPVAPESGHPQNVPALGTGICPAWIRLSRGR